MWNRIKHWWEAQGELAKLQGVSDRMLADIGLKRESLRDRVLGYKTDPEPPIPCACGPAGRLARG